MNKLDPQYIQLLEKILHDGIDKETRNGKTRSLFGETIRYKFENGKFPILTTKKMAWKQIVTELIWFLNGDTNVKYLHDNNCHIWDGDLYRYNYSSLMGKDATYTQDEYISMLGEKDNYDVGGKLGKIYGYQWRNWMGRFDQIDEIIHLLKTDPDSRRMVVSAWAPHEMNQMALPPCHYAFQFYTRELTLKERKKIASKHYDFLIGDDPDHHNKLDRLMIPRRGISLLWTQRSVDTFLGLPFNISSYGLLLSIIAKEVNMVPLELIGNLGDTHIYHDHFEAVRMQLLNDPMDLPELKINSTIKLDNLFVDGFELVDYRSHGKIKAKLLT